MAYVRIGDYQKQQQTAALLHKNFPQSGPYYCWRVMSILMQVLVMTLCVCVCLCLCVSVSVRERESKSFYVCNIHMYI